MKSGFGKGLVFGLPGTALLWLVIAAIVCTLTGCAQKREIVSVPTPVACVKAATIPAEPERVASKLNGDARHDLPIVAVSALDLRDYAGKLRALLVGCQ